MKINVPKLDKELRDAGIPIHGCASSGRIDFKDEATQEQKDLANKILSAHVSTWYVDDRKKEYPLLQDQLDMIYHDKENGTDNWFNLIKTIKNKYPKN